MSAPGYDAERRTIFGTILDQPTLASCRAAWEKRMSAERAEARLQASAPAMLALLRRLVAQDGDPVWLIEQEARKLIAGL
jgi:hypothetical protein